MQPVFLTAEPSPQTLPHPFPPWGAGRSGVPDTDLSFFRLYYLSALLYLGFAPGCYSPVQGCYKWQEGSSLKCVIQDYPKRVVPSLPRGPGQGMNRKMTGQFVVCLSWQESVSLRPYCKRTQTRGAPTCCPRLLLLWNSIFVHCEDVLLSVV